jgi:hypothetical protein
MYNELETAGRDVCCLPRTAATLFWYKIWEKLARRRSPQDQVRQLYVTIVFQLVIQWKGCNEWRVGKSVERAGHSLFNCTVSLVLRETEESHENPEYGIRFSRIWHYHGGKYEDDCLAAPRSLLELFRRFRWNCCFRYQGSESHRPDDWGGKYLWNVSKLLPEYTTLPPIRHPFSISCKIPIR